MSTSEADVDAVNQIIDSVPENATGNGNDSGSLQPTSDAPVSNVGSHPVQHSEQETELANPLDSSNDNAHLTSTAADSTPSPLMNESETNPSLLIESANNNAIGTGQTSTSPISEVHNAQNVDIKALLSAIPLQPEAITTNQQIESGSTSVPAHPETTADLISANGELPKSQPPNALGDLTSLPALMQSNLTNVSLPSSIPAPILTTGANGLPPPPSASFQQVLPPAVPLPAIPGAAIGKAIDDDGPFPPELEGPYEEFLREERANLNEGNWEKFPDGSRLFIGNLPTEKVSKRDVFKRFFRYGKLAQISLKQAYGFVQYLDAESCSRAKDGEQDSSIKGRKIHLEISRPNRGGKDRPGRRRSRSPDYRNRGDRYSGGATNRERDRDHRRNRDDYRPNRSPSPRGYRRGRSPDHYDGRRRSRSRSPYRDPRHLGRAEIDDLPLPHRSPQDVPDVQIIIVDDLSREFIGYVESPIKKKGLRCDVLILSPRLSEDAVIRRQIVEGVLAVIRLSRINQVTGKIPVKLFDRRAGVNNVKFEDYENLDPQVAAEVIFRAKSTHIAPPQAYPPPGPYGAPPSYGAPPGVNAQPDLASLISQLSSRPDAQGLLNALQSQSQIPNQPTSNLPPGVSQQLLSTLGTQAAPGYDQAANQSHFALASLLGQQSSVSQSPGLGTVQNSLHQGQNPQGQTPDMQEIMAQLAKYQR